MTRTVIDLDDAMLAFAQQQLRGQVGEPSLLHADGDFASIAKVRPGIAMIRVD
jgi:hypothetical protein